eukprot:5755238-Ditylum_brightwellii.AAC.1
MKGKEGFSRWVKLQTTSSGHPERDKDDSDITEANSVTSLPSVMSSLTSRDHYSMNNLIP